jgi:proteasome lid subunit RPN8/RPN11
MEKINFKRLFIPDNLWNDMRAHVERETPFEACGILGGKQSGVDLFASLCIPARNELKSAYRYRMDARDQLDAFNQLEKKGLKLAAIYHSHPHGPASPSGTDIEQAYYPETVHLIWSYEGNQWECRGYSIRAELVQKIPVIITGAIEKLT